MDITLVEHGQYYLLVYNEGRLVGTLTRRNRIPKWIHRDVDNDKDRSLISSVDKPSENVHLYFGTIKECFRKKGYFSEAMKQFEARCTSEHFKVITLLTKEEHLEMYKGMGYESLGFLESVGYFLMKKQLQC